MAKTSVDARRHIRAWNDFFRGAEIASVEAVEAFLEARAARKYLKQSLRRLVAGEFVREQKGSFALTRKGRRFFSRFGGRKSIGMPVAKWDGKWRLISFDVPGDYNIARDRLRAILKEYGFYQLHKSVWACPVVLSPDFWKLIVDEKLDRYCKVMVVDILEGDEQLKAHFRSFIIGGVEKGKGA